MNFLRNYVDSRYDRWRDRVFAETEDNPEKAHEDFIELSRALTYFHLEKLFFDCDENKLNPSFKIANAAGFNKNGDIPPEFIKALGFDINIVGTVTGEKYEGNPERPRMWRFPETNSLVNFLGLPGEGPEKVAENLSGCGRNGIRRYDVPAIVSVMATPGKEGRDAIEDVRNTVSILKGVYNVIGFQFNGSCPNTPEAEDMLEAYLETIRNEAYPNQKIEIKISPDVDEGEVERIITFGERFGAGLIAATNTTKLHNERYIPNSPNKGGASGDALYLQAHHVQNLVEKKLDEIGSNMEISAIGGINSAERARERTSSPRTNRIELYTGLIYKGPKLLRELRSSE